MKVNSDHRRFRRVPRTTRDQFAMMLDYMKKCATSDCQTMGYAKNKLERQRWIELTKKLNACPGGSVKSEVKWIKTWVQWKSNVRTKRYMELKQAQNGNIKESKLNQLDIKLLEFLKEEGTMLKVKSPSRKEAENSDDISLDDIEIHFVHVDPNTLKTDTDEIESASEENRPESHKRFVSPMQNHVASPLRPDIEIGPDKDDDRPLSYHSNENKIPMLEKIIEFQTKTLDTIKETCLANSRSLERFIDFQTKSLDVIKDSCERNSQSLKQFVDFQMKYLDVKRESHEKKQQMVSLESRMVTVAESIAASMSLMTKYLTENNKT